jgi:hypothetical protein
LLAACHCASPLLSLLKKFKKTTPDLLILNGNIAARGALQLAAGIQGFIIIKSPNNFEGILRDLTVLLQPKKSSCPQITQINTD